MRRRSAAPRRRARRAGDGRGRRARRGARPRAGARPVGAPARHPRRHPRARRSPTATSPSPTSAPWRTATTDATAAFRAAVDACARAGGGRVVVPPGVFLTGPIHLRSNVNLHVSEGATIRFSRDPAAYLPVVLTRWEGVELMGLLAARLRLRAARHRDHRQGHAGRPGGRRALVAVEEERPPAEPEARPRPALRPGRGRRARRRARLRRRPLPAAPVHPALPLHERPHRGRHDHERPDVAHPPGAVAERDRARRHRRLLGAEQRRLRPRVLDRRPDRGHPLRHRRRLHRDQVGPQRRRPAPRRPRRADRRARLPHARRPRRGDDRQRGERERARRLRGAER